MTLVYAHFDATQGWGSDAHGNVFSTASSLYIGCEVLNMATCKGYIVVEKQGDLWRLEEVTND